MDMYLASSGQKVTSLDELQDIDELMVVERLLPAAFAPSLPVSTRDLAPGTPGTAPADTDKGTAITRLGRRKKGKRSSVTLGAALMAVAVVFCLVTMIWFMLRGAPGIA
ncbi:uncharacterized protein HaLaN_02241, partial [Haematococcus lacustris]